MAEFANASSSSKETTFTKIFVGGLPYQTNDESLRRFFEQFGAVEEAVVIMDRITGKSKGYGFVTMGDKPSAERACLDPNPIIDGRKANVNLAYLGAKPRTFPYLNANAVLPMMQSGSAVIPPAVQAQYSYGYGTTPVQYMLTPSGYVAVMPSSPSAGLQHGLLGQQPTTMPATASNILPDNDSSNLEDSVSSIETQQQAAAQLQQAAHLQKYAALGVYPIGANANSLLSNQFLAAQQPTPTASGLLPATSVYGSQQLFGKHLLATGAATPAYYAYAACPQLIGKGLAQYQPQAIQDRTQ